MTVYSKVKESEIIDKYIGKYCVEEYREIVNVKGERITQGLGLKGIVKKIVINNFTNELVAVFDTNEEFKACSLKWVNVI
jgi:hypothetical protein